jgi:hypothetical protein
MMNTHTQNGAGGKMKVLVEVTVGRYGGGGRIKRKCVLSFLRSHLENFTNVSSEDGDTFEITGVKLVQNPKPEIRYVERGYLA